MNAESAFHAVQANIAKVANMSARDIKDVELIAVSKTFPVEDIKPVIDAGCSHFAENRVLEAYDKWHHLKKTHPHITLHLIGHLQSNKAKLAVELFDVIHSVDSEKLAAKIAQHACKINKQPELFIQVNIANEQQKRGIQPQETASFIMSLRQQYGLDIAGLMCIPPIEGVASKYFMQLKELARKIDKLGLQRPLKLSMGMSADYVQAIECGSNYVRIGSAIFGQRK
ncbi:YggS family pyridoxal phosphate-dependent enzyme [Gammaproteobacteria bacterium]|nr:YggS family pyridoxal phosphate-dependent enzyme [Gammaproteobacteria bacterium]